MHRPTSPAARGRKPSAQNSAKQFSPRLRTPKRSAKRCSPGPKQSSPVKLSLALEALRFAWRLQGPGQNHGGADVLG
eukprot:6084623-Alexandrium_andersonii.AAC.1